LPVPTKQFLSCFFGIINPLPNILSTVAHSKVSISEAICKGIYANKFSQLEPVQNELDVCKLFQENCHEIPQAAQAKVESMRIN